MPELTCPACAGAGRVGAHLSCLQQRRRRRRSHCGSVLVRCGRCAATGSLTAAGAALLATGQALRRDRLARGLLLHEEARRLGVPLNALAAAERGRAVLTLPPTTQQEPLSMPAGLFTALRITATPGALEALGGPTPEGAVMMRDLLNRHYSGDWAACDEHDRAVNQAALAEGGRLLSAFVLPSGTRVWMITEADRSQTTALLPSEY